MEWLKKSNKQKKMESLQEALVYFELLSRFEGFLKSIEEVAMRVKSKERHDVFCKTLNKEIVAVRAKHTIKNIKSVDSQIIAENMIDCIAASFKIFHAVFMLDTNPTYLRGSMKSRADILLNVCQTGRDLCDLFFNISRRKQNILQESFAFTEHSQRSLKHFLENNSVDFTVAQQLAVFHLGICIREYEKLHVECAAAEKLNLESFPSARFLISTMVNGFSRQMDVLKKLKEKFSCKQEFELSLSSEEKETNLLVFFECYANIMLLCNMMIENPEYEDNGFTVIPENKLSYNDGISFLDRLQYSILSLIENEQYTNEINVNVEENDERNKFCIQLLQFGRYLEWKFKGDRIRYTKLLEPFVDECLRIICCYSEQEEYHIDNDLGVIETASEAVEENYAMVKFSNIEPSSSSNSLCQSSISGDGINTLHDALEYFGLSQRFKDLEESLEAVRRNKISNEEHESFLKDFDKELQNLSRQYHPDRVKNRGGTEVELEKAQKLQTALNATRTVLSFLNKTFLEDLDIDHKYGFFSNLKIGVLGNEDEVENHVFDVLFKISYLSEIKQQRIIAGIRKFLIKSQNCLNSFVSNDKRDFQQNSFSAMKCLEKTIQWYEKLIKEYEDVEKECTLTKTENMVSLLRKMKNESSRQLRSLKMLHQIASLSPNKSLREFGSLKPVDDYYVLPFVRYIKTILMCHAMTKPVTEGCFSKAKKWVPFELRNPLRFHSNENKISFLTESSPDEDPLFADAFYLASYYSGDRQYQRSAMDVLKKLNDCGIEDVFRKLIEEIRELLENQFEIDAYTEKSANVNVRNDIKKCITMAATFDKKAKQLAKEISELREETRKMKEQKFKKKREDFSDEMQDA